MTQARARAAELLAGEDDRRVQIWARVNLGGERMSDLAGEFGYSDGSGILRVVQRLERKKRGHNSGRKEDTTRIDNR